MRKKQITSRSRAYRLLVERLERRSMLAADFDEAFFDWSQFDSAEQFDPESVDFADFGDAFWENDQNWYFGTGEEEPLPPDQETLLSETVGDDPTANAWAITDTEITDTEITDTEITDTNVVFTPDEETDTNPTLVVDPGVVENVTPVEPGEDVTVPVETESPTLELPLSSDGMDAELDGDTLGWESSEDAGGPVDGGYDSDETVSDTTVLDPADTPSSQADDGDVPDATPILDDLQPQDENDGSEESESPLADLPVQPAATTSGSAAAPRATVAPRSAAFAGMRMFAGFSFFTPQQEDTADGPIFAGGRRRVRR